MSDRAIARAPAKVILLGEHAVVFGYRALSASLSAVVEVEAERANAGGVRLSSPSPHDPRIDEALSALSKRAGVRDAVLRATSEIPVGGGLGSSAAFGVAAFRALSMLADVSPTDDDVIQAVFDSERVFHGFPSGVDHVTSTVGGLLLFRRGFPPDVARVRSPKRFAIVFGFSGISRQTSAQVASLRTRMAADPGTWEPVVAHLGSLSQQGAEALERGDLATLGALMNDAHAHLSTAGLSCAELDAIVSAARKAGALGAKLTGAGGGGAAIALTTDPESIENAVKQAGFGTHVEWLGDEATP